MQLAIDNSNITITFTSTNTNNKNLAVMKTIQITNTPKNIAGLKNGGYKYKIINLMLLSV